jgi:deoxyribonuclease-4
MPARIPTPIGAHVPVGSGLARTALPYARAIGAEAIQVFTSNPRGWAPAPGNRAQDAAFRAGCAEAGIAVFVHAPYLVNLASPTAATLAKSVDAVEHAVRRGTAIGAVGVVVHAGSAVTEARRAAALIQLREHLLPLLDALPATAPRILIEPSAGGGAPLAARITDLPAYLAALEDHPRLGLCLDTCHLHAAGHDLAQPGGVRTLLNALVRAVGRGRLGLVHANDSKDPAGSSRDRHERVGAGTIGLTPFAELFRHPATRGIPVVVETPGTRSEHAEDLAVLRALRNR